MPKQTKRLGRFVPPYLLVAIICLITGTLVAPPAGPPLFIAGALLLGAFIPILVIYYFACGLCGNS